MSKSKVKRIASQVDDDFKFVGALLRSKHGEPRTSCNGGIKREYFELGDGKIIMLASQEEEDGKHSTPEGAG